MKIAYLGCDSIVKEYLRSRETLTSIEDAEWLISYNHHQIIPPHILSQFDKQAINLHISHLPWGRGAHPNVWSWIEDSPKGVTIHQMDEGIDTGPILLQRSARISETETLRSSYLMLQAKIQSLFIFYWEDIKNGYFIGHAQAGKGSYHNKKELEEYQYLINWDMPISKFLDGVGEYQMSRQFWEKAK